MILNGTFFVFGLLSFERWNCWKYADIGFSLVLAFCFFTAAVDLSIKASGISDGIGGSAAVPAFIIMLLYSFTAYKKIKVVYEKEIKPQMDNA